MLATTIVRTEEGTLSLAFEPSEHKTAETAAKALYAAIFATMRSYDSEQEPDIELMLQPPETAFEYVGVKAWRVCWEAGPWEWAIKASMQLHTPEWWTEPYYSFDLCFHDNAEFGTVDTGVPVSRFDALPIWDGEGDARYAAEGCPCGDAFCAGCRDGGAS